MAADIGARVGIDGEKAFRDSLGAINSQLKALGSEMKSVVSSFAGMEDSEEAVAAKSDVLQRSVAVSADKIRTLQSQSERAKAKLSTLSDELENAKLEFGENSEQAIKAQNAYNRQVTAANKLETQINQTTAEMSRMETEMRDLSKGAEDLSDDLQDAGQGADDMGSSFRDAFLGGAIAGAVQALAGGVSNLVESTTEYRKIMGTLDVSSKKAGYSAEKTAQTYEQLYGVIGDNQQAATAAANLQALNLSQEKLTLLTDGAIGAWATYGDSIPIDSLSEAINETVQAGKVTGTFADVLNWAGTSEDAFNEKLAAAGSESERANIVLEELANQGLMSAAEGWRQNNEEILAANEATAGLEETTGRLGAMLSPMVTGLKEDLNSVLSTLLDMVEQGNPLIAMVAGLAVALAGIGLATFITQGGAAVGVLTKMKTGFEMVNAAMRANPILLVVSLLAGLVAALVTAYQTNEEFRNKVNAAWTAVEDGIGTAVQAAIGFIDGLVEKFRAFIDWLKNLPKEMKTIGGNLITGLWNGISDKVGWLKGKVSGVVDKIKSCFTSPEGFDTHSPSKFTEKVGGWVMQGIGKGMEEDTTAVRAVKAATGEIKEVFADTAQDIEKSSEQIAAAVDTMSGKLEDYGGLFDTVNTEDGNFIQLADLQKDIETIENYRKALADLKAKGVTDGLFEEITSMNVDDAMGYMKELLSMTQEDLDTYISLYEQKKTAAEEVAKQFYGVGAMAAESMQKGLQADGEAMGQTISDAVSTAVVGANEATQAANMQQIVAGMQTQEPVLTEYVEALKTNIIALIQGFHGEFFDVGNYLMEGVADGVEAGRSGLINTIVRVLQAAVRAARAAMDINSPSGVYEEIGEYMAAGLDVGWTNKMKSVKKSILNSMSSVVATPKLTPAAAGMGGYGSPSYSYGDIVIHIDKVDNGNGRDVQTMARELEFYRRHQDTGRGGGK